MSSVFSSLLGVKKQQTPQVDASAEKARRDQEAAIRAKEKGLGEQASDDARKRRLRLTGQRGALSLLAGSGAQGYSETLGAG